MGKDQGHWGAADMGRGGKKNGLGCQARAICTVLPGHGPSENSPESRVAAWSLGP